MLGGGAGGDIILGDSRDWAPVEGLDPALAALDAEFRQTLVTAASDTPNRPRANDTILGGGGDDVLLGMAGADRIIGGHGNDSIHGGTGGDEVWGDNLGDDQGEVGPQLAAATGIDDAGVVVAGDDAGGGDGTPRMEVEPQAPDRLPTHNDLIFGARGDDRLSGQQGWDIVWGGVGDDRISGGSGGDYLEGLAGDDALSGGAGGDVIFGGAGNDKIDAGRGNDYAIGGGGDDALSLGAGRDWGFGDATDSYPAGYVNPWVYARDFAGQQVGDDTVEGGDGADIVFGRPRAMIEWLAIRATTCCWAAGAPTPWEADLAPIS